MFRISPCRFEEFLNIVAPDLIKPNARCEPTGPDQGLAVNLRNLATFLMPLLRLHKVIE